MYISLYRTFTHPIPFVKIVLDDVSSLTTALIKRLKLGCCHGCKLSLYFRRDVFNVLFNNCGSSVRRRPGNYFIVLTLIVCIFVMLIFFLNDSNEVFLLIFLFVCIVPLSLIN